MKVGYARISTREQNLDMQVDALQKAGCLEVHREVVSGLKADRLILDALMEKLMPGDVLVVWKLDRLGRSLAHLIKISDMLIKKEVGLFSLNDHIDTTTPQGRLIFNMFAALAEFERDIIVERTKAGLEAARARGISTGRPKGISAAAELTACAAETLYRENKLSAVQICNKLSISRNTLYKYLKMRNVPITHYNKHLIGI
jgi:DNA invertase Pin-like site-specific DNA recombinase